MESAAEDGWEALEAWGRARLGDRLSGGTVNDVREVVLDGRMRVARLSSRGGADLDWEIALLDHLRAVGLGVPQLVAAGDGSRRIGGVVVMEMVHGAIPQTDADWTAVAAYLGRLHRLTARWPLQRPGWRSVSNLVHDDASGPVDLGSLPDDVRSRCRRAWARLADRERSVIHGDPNATNIRIFGPEVVMMDWDEARVDVPLLDLADLPAGVTALSEPDRHVAQQAAHAWEAAMAWTSAPDYARRRLDALD